MLVSDVLRSALAHRGITQAVVAQRLGVSQPAIASVLSVGNPQARVLIRILHALDYRLVAVPQEVDLPYSAIEFDAPDD